MSIDIKLDRSSRIYNPGEKVTGSVIVMTNSSIKHAGVKLLVEGSVTLQLSARSIGLFEAFYSSLKPVELINLEIEVSPGGKIAGTTELPFEFLLHPNKDQTLHDTYHGVYVNVQYMLSVEMTRTMMAKSLKVSKEFIVQVVTDEDTKKEIKHKKFGFKISPDSLQNVKEASKKKIPGFLVDGYLASTTCNIEKPFAGEVWVRHCDVDIQSLELQLVRVESCTYAEGEAREATEIQNIQIADGNVVRNLAIPLHMIFPRLFTCSTTIAKQFKVEFEINLIVLFSDNHMVTENFPLKLYR